MSCESFLNSTNLLSYWWLFLLILIIGNITVFIVNREPDTYVSKAYFVTKLGDLNPEKVAPYIDGHLGNRSIVLETRVFSDYGLYFTFTQGDNREQTIIDLKVKLDLIEELAKQMWFEPPNKVQEIIDLSSELVEKSDGKVTLKINPITLEMLISDNNIGPFVKLGNIITTEQPKEFSLYYYITSSFLLIVITYIMLIIWHNRNKIFDLNIWNE